MESKNLIVFLLLLLVCNSCHFKSHSAMDTCKDEKCKNPVTGLACKLTTPELQQRKATVIASLRKQVIERKELENGYAFKFNGSDKMIDELTEFVKTERQCCDFFTFNFSIAGDTSSVTLEIVGPKGAKEFIVTELEM